MYFQQSSSALTQIAVLLTLWLLRIAAAQPNCFNWPFDPPTYNTCMEAFQDLELDLAAYPDTVHIGQAVPRIVGTYQVPRYYTSYDDSGECVIAVDALLPSGSDEISKRDVANAAVEIISTCLKPDEIEGDDTAGGTDTLGPLGFVSVRVGSMSVIKQLGMKWQNGTSTVLRPGTS